MRLPKKSGFTLIELIIVVIIIAILAAVAVPMMQSMKVKTICSEAIIGMNTIRNAIRQYYAEYQIYPTITSTYNGRLVSIYQVAGADYFRKVFPGLTSPGDLQGTYVSKECYFIMCPYSSSYRILCYTDPDSYGWPSSAARAIEFRTISDVPFDGNAMLIMDSDGSVHQTGISKSGY